MSEKEPLDDNSKSHGICPDCFDYYMNHKDGLTLDEYLDKFERPVLIVDTDGRIIAANKIATDMAGNSPSKLNDLLVGDAVECVYARWPDEGCGQTIDCTTCSIRNTVQSAMESGEARMNVPVILIHKNSEKKILISTQKIDRLVRILFEPAG